MELVKIKSITKKQAKAYMVIALRNLKASPNEITEQAMWDGMETVMALYTPQQAVNNVKDKIRDTYRVKNKNK